MTPDMHKDSDKALAALFRSPTAGNFSPKIEKKDKRLFSYILTISKRNDNE